MGQELSFPCSFNDQRNGRILPSWFTPDNDFNMNDYKKISLWIHDTGLLDPMSYTISERRGESVMTIMFSVIGHRIEALCPIFASKYKKQVLDSDGGISVEFGRSLFYLIIEDIVSRFTYCRGRLDIEHARWEVVKLLQDMSITASVFLHTVSAVFVSILCFKNVSINSCGVNGLARLYSSIYINLLDVNDDLLLTLTAEDTLLSENSQMIEWSSLLTTNYPIIDLPNEWMIHIINALNAYLLENPLGTKLECILYTLHDICDFAHGKQEELLMCGEDQDQESIARHILQHRVLLKQLTTIEEDMSNVPERVSALEFGIY